jgi:hypothetical protein
MNALKRLVSLALFVAHSFIGIKEVPLGSNRGPEVTKFLNAIGLSGGYPWCAAFVWFCIQKAASQLATENPFIRSGGCVLFERWAKQKSILHDEPEAGDVFLCYSIPEGEGRKRASHTGFVTAVNLKKRTFTTIEGNTNLGGSREGIGVFERERPIDERYKFIRYNDIVREIAVVKQPAPAKVERRVEQPWAVFLNGKLLYQAPSIDGRVWMPLKLWCSKLGVSFGFDEVHQVVKIQGKEAPVDTRSDRLENGLNLPFAPVRQLVKFSGLKMDMDAVKREIHISRPAGARPL